MEFSQYTIEDTKKVFQDFNSSQQGLSEKEAEKRQQIYGLNEVRLKEVGTFDILLRQFKSPFFYLLFIVSIITFLFGEIIDGIVIIIFIFINISLGFLQESRAVRAASILKKYLPPRTLVFRDGEEKTIEQRFLVPGDIVMVEAGNIIPADLRIIKTKNFIVDESVLSGESVPVPKITDPLEKETGEIFEAQNICFTGTSVISGEAEGIVIGTGKKTVIGEIAKLTAETVRESVYEKDLLHLSRLVLRIVVATGAFVFLGNLILKGRADLLKFLGFSIALIVSIIPEALPLVVTSAFSQGALIMAKKKVLVKRLSAIEDLGNVEILCTDKTGTITENKLKLVNIRSANKDKCLLYGLSASSCIKEEIESVMNPFDLALFRETTKEMRQYLKTIKAIAEIPFDSFRMKNSVLLRIPEGDKILIVRGAPEFILKLSSSFEEGIERLKIEEEIKREGREGKRVLAVAFKKFEKDEFTEADEKNLTFLGYFSFHDPLKAKAIEAIQLAKTMGIKIKIITGDSKEVAGKIGKEVGLIDNTEDVILGEKLDSLSIDEFKNSCQKFSVFARISPRTKFRIVESLQKQCEVGFLGEGINDAPALKIANVAIAVKEGADISREASDIILLEKDLRVLIDGIEEGRKIFSNVNKYIKCTLASNFGNFYSIAVISLKIPYLPMLPVQILLVNLLSDFPLISVASDSVDTKELKKPKLYQLKKMISLIISLALVSTVFDFIFFALFYKSGPPMLQTMWFIESILTEILLIFVIRTSGFFLKARFPSKPLVVLSLATIATTIFLPFTKFGQEFFHFVSPTAHSLIIVFFLLIGYLLMSEIVKLIYFKRYDRKNNRC
jgi:Mg2+-importing ATPase